MTSVTVTVSLIAGRQVPQNLYRVAVDTSSRHLGATGTSISSMVARIGSRWLSKRCTGLFVSMDFRLNHRFSMTRQICSYDMVAVPPGSYTVTDGEGDMYLCNS
jgi:hypothetical protein